MKASSSSAKSKPASTWAKRSTSASRRRFKGWREPAGQLGQGDVQGLWAAGIDDAQDGFRLGQIDPAGQKGPQRELPWARQAAPAVQTERKTICNKGGEPSV